jgi:hypothetical protein
MRALALLSACALGLAVPASSDAAEKQIQRSDVPNAVLNAVAAKYPKAAMTRFVRETEDGKVVFEVAVESEGHKAELAVTPDGAILEEERQISVKELPEAVRTALASSAYSAAEVLRVEVITETKKPEAPTFELLVKQGSAKRELVFDQAGKLTKDQKVGDRD